MAHHHPQLKVMILAAGLGTRLLPLTKILPKPLIPIFGVPLLHLLLLKVKSAGFKSVAINVHHHIEKIQASLDIFQSQMDYFLSREEPTLLGTAGAYRPIHKWREGKDLLVLNGDIVSDLNLEDLISVHFDRNPGLATLLLCDPPAPGKTLIWCKDHRIISIGEKPQDPEAKPYSFSCVQILSDELLEQIQPSKEKEIIPIYLDLLRANKPLKANIQKINFWHDIGSISSLFNFHKNLMDHKQSNDLLGTLHILEALTLLKKHALIVERGEVADLDEGQVLGPAFILLPCKLSSGSQLGPYTILQEESHFLGKSSAQNSMVLSKKTFTEAVHMDHLIWLDEISCKFK
ncbi:MAG: NDP-sugar synthase [Oligoflexales bacterium]|nr:NDP-sugar synthase [Oligoflexales bacterium]